MKRRTFLKTTAATVAATTTAMALDAKTYAQAPGANERIGVAFLGVGGRCQQHIDVILAMQQATRNSVRPVAVCDVWDGNATLGRRPMAPQAAVGCSLGAPLRPQRDDAFTSPRTIAGCSNCAKSTPSASPRRTTGTPRCRIDAAGAGKHIYCEKPMTKTIDEAHAVVDAARGNNVVMTVGVQSMADPTCAAPTR